MKKLKLTIGSLLIFFAAGSAFGGPSELHRERMSGVTKELRSKAGYVQRVQGSRSQFPNSRFMNRVVSPAKSQIQNFQAENEQEFGARYRLKMDNGRLTKKEVVEMSGRKDPK